MPAFLGMSLEQTPKALAKAEGKTVYLPCKAKDMSSSDYVHWYQIKDGKAPSRLLYITKDGAVSHDSNNHQANDFTVDKTKLYDLKLSDTQKSHAAVYFCAYWGSGYWIKRFGTGTRLIVTDRGGDTIIAPTLTGYLPSKKQSGKQTALCQAKDMFPDLVKFTWKKKSNGEWTAVSEENVVEQRTENNNKVIVTSMLIIDQNTAGDNYECTVTHEGSTGSQSKTLMDEKKEKKAETSDNANVNTTCPPNNETLSSGSSDQIPSQSLFVYAYGVMIMKNGLYCCAVFIVLLKRKVGKKEESS